MKELSIEEKAKRYDEAIKTTRKWYDANTNEGFRGIFEEIFPELKENGDERIRKSIICGMNALKDQKKETFADISIDDCIAYLEKQGTSTNKVEPKFNFKVGQWIVATGKCVYLIAKIDGFEVTLFDTNGNEHVFDASSLDDAHEWTIQDARDGDVLVNKAGCPFIFKDTKTCWCYYSISCGVFRPKSNKWFFSPEDHLCPATKEQRDTLERAMADAGYSWDTEKKELKKIGPDDLIEESYQQQADDLIDMVTENSAWNEEDENINQSIIDILTKQGFQTQVNWLKSLRNRVQPQPKQGWNEDTQQWIDAIIKDYEELYDKDKDHRATTQAIISILKSIRPQNRWKPSNEQMNAFDWALSLAKNCGEECAFDLRTLQDQLKKLKEE